MTVWKYQISRRDKEIRPRSSAMPSDLLLAVWNLQRQHMRMIVPHDWSYKKLCCEIAKLQLRIQEFNEAKKSWTHS